MQGDILAIFKNRPFNAIINGAMDYWQRGTNVNALNAYGPDRFRGNAFSGNFSRFDQNDGDAGVALEAIGFEYGAYSEQGAGGGSFIQRIESLMMEMFDVGEKVTFSFYAASATVNATGVMLGLKTPNVKDNFSATSVIALNAGGGTDFDDGIYLGDLLDRSVAFTRYTYTFTVTEEMKRGLQIEIYGDLRSAGVAGYLTHTNAITGVMLNSGNKPPKFYRAGGNRIGELQLCQRYFEKSYEPDTPPGTATTLGCWNWQGGSSGGNGGSMGVRFSAVKRVIPVVRTYSTVGGTIDRIYSSAGGIIASTSYQSVSGFRANMDSGASWIFMEAQFTADAEL